MRRDEQTVRLVGSLFEDHPQPEGLEPPHAALSPHADPLDREGVAGEPDRLAAPRAAIAETKGDIDECDVQPEKSDHRPSADRDETDADREADQAEDQHQDVKAARRQAAVRPQHALEKEAVEGCDGSAYSGACGHRSENIEAGRALR